MHEPELCNDGALLRSPSRPNLACEALPSWLRLEFRRPECPGATADYQNAGAVRIAGLPSEVNTKPKRLNSMTSDQPRQSAWMKTRCCSPISRAAGVTIVRSPMTIFRPCRTACLTSSSQTKSAGFTLGAAGAGVADGAGAVGTTGAATPLGSPTAGAA